MRVLPLVALALFLQDFSIDRRQPVAVTNRDVAVREVTFPGPAGEPIEATLIAPATKGPHPAVLFVHWYGPEHTNSNRTQYVPDALMLARQGITSMLVDTPWSEPSWFRRRDPGSDVAFSTDMVKRLRRAVDVLASVEGVDVTRLALVGHDFGAMYGAVGCFARAADLGVCLHCGHVEVRRLVHARPQARRRAEGRGLSRAGAV